jgi:hypothetical protein
MGELLTELAEMKTIFMDRTAAAGVRGNAAPCMIQILLEVRAMENERVYLDLPADIKAALRGVDLETALREEGIEAGVEYGPLPGAVPKEAERELALIIIAAGVTATLIGKAIAKIIDARSHRPVTYTEKVSRPVVKDGKVVMDKHGKPVMETVETTKVHEMQSQPPTSTDVTFAKILTFHDASGEKAMTGGGEKKK